MLDSLKRFWNERPLLAILLIALVPRLVAAVFSEGYAMHDDHFGPIEQPFIVMHYPAYWTERTTPHGHSIVYPSIHYALFKGLEAINIRDPQTTMLIVRLLHALYSLLVVYFAFKIAELLSNRDTAKRVGIMLALFWAFPFLGVRNLIEVVCVPPLMAGFYYLLKSEDARRDVFYAGVWFGVAFVFRYQTLLIPGTVGLLLLSQKKFQGAVILGVGFLASTFVLQGSADTFAWGYPFASFIEYVRYNAAHGEDYTTGPWYNYTLLIIGALIPPVSFFLLYGLIRNWKKTLTVLLPVMVFFVLHSYFPNKQERFIFPVMPLILVLSTVGWEEFAEKSVFWLRHRKSLNALWVWFWVVNIVLLIAFSTYYGKKPRVEAVYSLYGKPVTALFLAGGKDGISQPPFFYGGTYPVLTAEISSDEQLALARAHLDTSSVHPNYVLFFGADDFYSRIQRIQLTLRLKLTLERQSGPSFVDYILYRLNPTHNKNETIFVFRVDYL